MVSSCLKLDTIFVGTIKDLPNNIQRLLNGEVGRAIISSQRLGSALKSLEKFQKNKFELYKESLNFTINMTKYLRESLNSYYTPIPLGTIVDTMDRLNLVFSSVFSILVIMIAIFYFYFFSQDNKKIKVLRSKRSNRG